MKKDSRLQKIIHKHTCQKPEIIAAICAYNEQLNIHECLTHLEEYVDKIILFDDGSTDNTVKLAKKHKKVKKIILNNNKTHWDEKKNRQTILKEAYLISEKQNPWVLCVDADERFEKRFLSNLRKIAASQKYSNSVIGVYFRELWESIDQYRSDGIWNKKKKYIFFPLSDNMTFDYPHDHHIKWHYQELNGKDKLLNYNLYHLKMIKSSDRQARVKLYNELDPKKTMQPIGYDYLTDTTNLILKKIPKNHRYDKTTVPNYYK